jgi:hypothetical protein
MIHTILGKCVCAGTCLCLVGFSGFMFTKINSVNYKIMDEKIIDSPV